MSERTKELGKLAYTMYAHSLSIESMYEYKVHGTWQVGTIWPMDLVLMSTFNDQSMSIG